MNKDSRIYIAGHNGLVGSAIVKTLQQKGYTNIIGKDAKELDLRNPMAVKTFFDWAKPEYVFLAAAKVGGIVANNTYRAEFIYDNLMIQNNIIHQSYLSGVKKLLFLGSTCIYPKDCPQPMKEEYLLTGPLEYTNEPYAIAKIAGIKMCESYNIQYGTNFISVMPTNLYGPNDNFDLEKSHVLPALIRKIHLGKCLEENNWEAIRIDLERRPLKEMMERQNDRMIERQHDSEKVRKYEGANERQHDRTIERQHDSEKVRKYEGANERQNDGKEEGKGIAWQLTEEEIIGMLSNYGIRSIAPSSNRTIALSSNRPIVQVEIWGSGSPLREFLWSEEMADACVFLMENVDFSDLTSQPEPQPQPELRNTHINIGTGKEISIKELAELVKLKVGYKGVLFFNSEKPDGTMRKLTDPSKLHKLGWKHKIEIDYGIEKMYDWYCNITK